MKCTEHTPPKGLAHQLSQWELAGQRVNHSAKVPKLARLIDGENGKINCKYCSLIMAEDLPMEPSYHRESQRQWVRQRASVFAGMRFSHTNCVPSTSASLVTLTVSLAAFGKRLSQHDRSASAQGSEAQ